MVFCGCVVGDISSCIRSGAKCRRRPADSLPTKTTRPARRALFSRLADLARSRGLADLQIWQACTESTPLPKWATATGGLLGGVPRRASVWRPVSRWRTPGGRILSLRRTVEAAGWLRTRPGAIWACFSPRMDNRTADTRTGPTRPAGRFLTLTGGVCGEGGQWQEAENAACGASGVPSQGVRVVVGKSTAA